MNRSGGFPADGGYRRPESRHSKRTQRFTVSEQARKKQAAAHESAGMWNEAFRPQEDIPAISVLGSLNEASDKVCRTG